MPSRARTRKQNRVLPPLGDDIHLSDFGYSLDKPKQERQKSLKRAAKKHSTLTVMRRTNLIANYSKSRTKSYKKLRQDVEYLKKEYRQEKLKKKEKKRKNTIKHRNTRKKHT